MAPLHPLPLTVKQSKNNLSIIYLLSIYRISKSIKKYWSTPPPFSLFLIIRYSTQYLGPTGSGDRKCVCSPRSPVSANIHVKFDIISEVKNWKYSLFNTTPYGIISIRNLDPDPRDKITFQSLNG